MQHIKTVCGEYFTAYITDTNELWHTAGGGNIYAPERVPVSNIVDGHGGQYASVFIDKAGTPFIIGYRQANGKFVTPIPFTGAEKCFALFGAGFVIRAGKVFAFGDDILNINGGKYITTPIELVCNKAIVKLDGGAAAASPFPTSVMLSGLATDGTVQRWVAGSKTAKQITTPAPVRDMAHIGCVMFVIETTTGDLMGTGIRPAYLGLPYEATTKFVSFKKQYTDKGCVFPSKELVGNYNTLHIIDQKDDMYGQGDNLAGEVGAGAEYDWIKNPSNFTPKYNAPWSGPALYQSVIQIPGKWKNLSTSNTITFYFHVQDLKNNWYSFGRNKARSLGNGITLNDADASAFPNGLDMKQPSFIKPLTQTWNVVTKFDPANPPKQTPIPAPVVVEPTPIPAPSKKKIATIDVQVGEAVLKATLFEDFTWSEGDGGVN